MVRAEEAPLRASLEAFRAEAHLRGGILRAIAARLRTPDTVAPVSGGKHRSSTAVFRVRGRRSPMISAAQCSSTRLIFRGHTGAGGRFLRGACFMVPPIFRAGFSTGRHALPGAPGGVK